MKRTPAFSRLKRQYNFLVKQIKKDLKSGKWEHYTAALKQKLIARIHYLLYKLEGVINAAYKTKVLAGLSLLFLSGSMNAQNLTYIGVNPFSIDLSNTAHVDPNFVDIDNDGDFDLLTKTSNGFDFQENIGTATNPIFSNLVANPFGLSTTVLGYPSMDLADIDDDGDLDIIVITGTIYLFENTGNPTNPAFAPAVADPFGATLNGDLAYSVGELIDFDNDGDIDIVVSSATLSYASDFQLIENIGTITNPVFDDATTGNFGIPVPHPISTIYGSLTFSDFDCDGDLDMIQSNEHAGVIYFFENISGNFPLTFIAPVPLQFGADTPVSLGFTNDVLTPEFVDIDGDGDMELFIGTEEKDLIFFEKNCGLSVDLTTSESSICEGECVDLEATPSDGRAPFIYAWDNGIIDTDAGPINVCPAATTTYTVTITDFLGAMATANTTITVSPLPTVFLGNDTTICVDASLLLDATTPGANYLWQDNSTNPTLNINSAGTYSVEIDVNGCTATDIIEVSYSDLSINLGPDIETCNPNLTLDATTDGATYLWQDNSVNPTFNVSAVGEYSVDVSVGNCTASDIITVEAGSIEVNLPDNMVLCKGEEIILDAQNPGATYLWQDNSTNQTFTVTQAGTYNVTATLGICNDNDFITVDYEIINIDFTAMDTTGCTPLTTLFADQSSSTNNNINQWSWDLGDGTTTNIQNPSHQYSQSGNYTVSLLATNENGCEANFSRTVAITLNPIPIVDFSYTPAPPSLKDLIEFKDLTTGTISAWSWDFGDQSTATIQNPTHKYSTQGIYNIELAVESEQGCTNSIVKTIEIKDELVFNFPNIFTPNADDVNDAFGVLVKAGNIKTFECIILNRWGNIVAELNDFSQTWNGIHKNGKLCLEGVYFYTYNIIDVNDEKYDGHGNIQLSRD